MHTRGEWALQLACQAGRLEVVRLLLTLEGDRRVNVHAENELAFRQACTGGHARVVRLLLALKGDRRINVHASSGTFR